MKRVSREGIQAGPWGRSLRGLVGAALLVEAGRHLLGSDAGVVMTAFAVVALEIGFYWALHLVIVRLFERVNPWLGALLAVLPVAAVFVMSDAPGKLGTLLFVGVSLLATAWRADGGCEVMTIPGMFMGRRTHLVCIAFSPLDWAEATLTGRAEVHESEEGR